MLLFQMALAQHGPGQTGPPEPGCLFPPFISLPLIVCAFIFSLYRLWGVCVRSGSFKHCSKSIALIKGITSQKREKKKNHKLLWGVVWSLKKRDIQSKCLSHRKRQYHREAFRNDKKRTYRLKQMKGKSATFSQSHQHSQCTSLMMNHIVFGPANVHLASKSHRCVTVVGSDPYLT